MCKIKKEKKNQSNWSFCFPQKKKASTELSKLQESFLVTMEFVYDGREIAPPFVNSIVTRNHTCNFPDGRILKRKTDWMQNYILPKLFHLLSYTFWHTDEPHCIIVCVLAY